MSAYQDLTRICHLIKTKESLINGNTFGKAADSLTKIINTSLNQQFYIKYNLALTYNEEENLNFDKALHYYNEGLAISKQTKDSIKIREAYLGLGNLHNVFDKEKSLQFYKTAISFTKKNDTSFFSDLHYGLGHTYSIWEDYKTSLKYRHKALKILTGNDFLQTETISIQFLTNFKHKRQLLINLEQLAQTYLNYYEVKKNNDFLEKTITYFKMCDVLIDNLKTNSSGFKSRLYWRKLSTDIYGKAIKACYLNNDLENAFYFMEKNKALLLLEDINNKSFKRTLQLPPDTLEQSNILKKNIAIINNHIINERKWSKNDIDSLKKQRIDLEIELSVLEGDTKAETLDIETTILSLQKVQNNLKNDEVLVEYHISIDDGYGILTNKDNGYALFITKNEAQLFEINNLNELQNEITSLINKFKTPFKTKENINTFNVLSNTVYNKLFPSKRIQKLIKGKTLNIAPDSYLSLIPFEALSTSTDSASYLIRDAEVHYIYSYSFLKSIENTQNNSSSKSLAIAPVTFKHNNLATLTNSEQEVSAIKNYYSGSTLLNKQASKVNFLKALNTTSNGIIHIASHANAQDKVAPWIAFNDENITLEELYLTQNNASLVVLSGCNTSLGEQEIGEGVMSLARGFFYSGSQSVISSLWSIDDRSTSEITTDFYKNLGEGQTKATALHNAKLNYINTHNLSEASPYYWSALILLGENDTLPSPKTPWLIYLIITLIVGLAILFFIKRKKVK